MSYKLLIVEDEWIIADSLSTLSEWQERDIRVVDTVGTGLEAIEYLKCKSVDLMITDIRMPDMNGLELLQYIYDHDLDINVIVISAYDIFSYAQTALKYKAEGYILKPIDIDELFHTVDEILERMTASERTLHSGDVPQTYQESIVQRAKSFITANIERPISLNETAEEVYLSAHHLGQIFKAVTNETFTAYLTRLRMERACELLRNPELRLYEISRQVGYADPRYFSKVFHKTYGVIPRRFRKQIFESGPNRY